MEKCTTFWQSKTNSNLIRVLYVSPTSWSKTMMADIDIEKQRIDIYQGNSKSDKKIIDKFEMEDKLDSKSWKGLQEENDSSILEEVVKIINANNDCNNDNYEFLNLKIHVESALNYNYIYTDVRDGFQAPAIMDLLKQSFLRDKTNVGTKSYYCGITNDLDIRMQQHREDDFEIVNDKVYAWICATVQIAIAVEELAKEKYDIGEKDHGGSGAKEDSVIVYLLKKGKRIKK